MIKSTDEAANAIDVLTNPESSDTKQKTAIAYLMRLGMVLDAIKHYALDTSPIACEGDGIAVEGVADDGTCDEGDL